MTAEADERTQPGSSHPHHAGGHDLPVPTVKAAQDKPSILAYVTTVAEVTFWTFGYWFVGLLPEDNHAKKGTAWARVGAYQWAAWHFQKYLKYSDDTFGRTCLAWCYAQMGMSERAVVHYRAAFASSRRPDVGCWLAHAELSAGNVSGARDLVPALSKRRHELTQEDLALLTEVEGELEKIGSAGGALSLARPGERRVGDLADRGEDRASAAGTLVGPIATGYVTFVTCFFLINVRYLFRASAAGPAQLIRLAILSLLAGLVFCVSLLIINGPWVTLVARSTPSPLERFRAATVGVVTAPAVFVLYFAILHVSGLASIRDVIAFWTDHPGDLLLWLLSFCTGGAVFTHACARGWRSK